MLTIDKGIPIPRDVRTTRKKYPYENMEIGDSFFVPGKTKISQLGSTIPNARQRYGFEFVSKREGDGLRVWRVS